MTKLVSLVAARSFIERCMTAIGTEPKHSVAMANMLIEADIRGHFTHGLYRLEMYMRDIENGVTQARGEPSLEKDFAATALVDGNNLPGVVVGNYCMDLAIKKAKDYGIGCVACRGSTHFGIAAWYSAQALQHGMIGVSLSNTSPVVVPTRAAKPSIGTNPLSVAAPGREGDNFLLDMATSAVAFGKLRMCRVKGIEMPQGWGVDSKGLETVNPVEAMDRGGLSPLGGAEITGGYKGFGLAMMVDVFCGILSGSALGTDIKRWKGQEERIHNLGHCFIAVNPKVYTDGFEDRMQASMDQYRNLEPAEGETAVFVAGDPEREHMRKVGQDGGIHYHENVLKSMDKIADRLGVAYLLRQ